MPEVLLEIVAFVALVAVAVVLLSYVVVQFTPLGTRYRQVQNRRAIEAAADRNCPIHGPHEEAQLVRLLNGERICPECFEEAVRGR